ncbi:hypothetical protein ELOC111193_07990 [Elizabethkingia occulta]|uniref:Fimbrillin family protein n=1 Tax=Elizabethkingia occulta TaxID=1867263 RepID=A0A1T3MYQ0_9FLAO|nr:hypothetical protein [Elizabethkingia occulta]OPB97758.1 hypothetical protein BB020_12970 [Elizabethkingia occulta]OPC69745.1 hypothetical protein BAZ10_17925 [Elizabethkingia occulta]
MNFKLQAAGYSLLALSFAVTSCRSTDNSIEENGINKSAFNVKINLKGIENIEELPVMQASANHRGINPGIVQKEIIPFDGDTFVTATITSKSSIQTQAATKSRAATVVPKELAEGVKYRVIVYDKNGAYKDYKEFTYKKNETDGFLLDGDGNYTFVAYSLNTNAGTPNTMVDKSPLSTAKIAGISGDLMYFKKNMTVTGNKDNTLDIVLRHQFSRITTKLDARQVGNISVVNNAVLTPAFTSADLNFATDAITYNNSITSGQAVNFPSPQNQPTVTSDETQVIAKTNTAAPEGILNIGTVTLDGVSKSLKVDKVNITPGVKYNLNLRFGPCRQDINPKEFAVKDGVAQDFSFPATDFGFVFDIYSLDNSFNLTINGVQLAVNEIQFQVGNATYPQNIKFQDGSAWQYGGIPPIYNMTGTKDTPLVRVVIGKDGSVSMFGSKVSNGPLFPLVLNGNSFNKITWNTTGSNTVRATQRVEGATNMSGQGTGKKIITCTP